MRIARLARELGCGDFVKIEIMRDSKYLLPDNQETVKATGESCAKEGFVVMPYMYPDLNVARDLVNARGGRQSCPWRPPSAPTKGWLPRSLSRFSIDEIDLPIIVDAGIGRPSQACEAMEMGAPRPSWPELPACGALPGIFAHDGGSASDQALSRAGAEELILAGSCGRDADETVACQASDPLDRISARLRRRGRHGKSIFCGLRVSLSRSPGKETPAGDRTPPLPQKPHGVSAGDGDASSPMSAASVMEQMDSYDYAKYTAKDVKAALEHETCTIEDFKALLSPAAEPFLEQMARRARRRPAAISETPFTCSPPFTSPTTVKTTAYTAASTATTTSSV